MNVHAPNFNPAANIDDGTCFKACIQSAPCATCLEAHEQELPSGKWWIGTPGDAYETYCDMNLAPEFFRAKNMTQNNGGWALIMKATPGDTFQYSSNYWDSGDGAWASLNADVDILNADLTLNMAVDAKYNAYNIMPATQYLVRILLSRTFQRRT
jgi:hypothetical protein